ncbi:hypothetical protein Belba_3070 [Belliella baltica DSM 15883]|uniref:Uncharacterized protein n=1 Tax=Belliella baltica (strain DSM 15883 / CIP 108006 / LMG 21964 / BA134) TaxID=866536 RepID=I3Z8L9_BELBD|nr:hypothetical protein [Belliella baltica]AFL85587.1 hypothetical protein Belba_3070 [Belliella baltica DSM 15883]
METTNNLLQSNIQVSSTRNPFDSRFNGHKSLMKDSEGNLYRIIEDLSQWKPKAANCEEFPLEMLRKSGIKPALQSYWDAGDIEALIEQYQKFKSNQVDETGIEDMVKEIIEYKSKLPNPAAFRLSEFGEAEAVVVNLLKQGLKPTKVHKMFSRDKVDGNGNPVLDTKGNPELEYAIGLPSITSRANNLKKEQS